jgi:hypothetical protein
MTLILTVANSRGIYQSSDYQLTDVATGAPVSDRAGSKQLEATFQALAIQLAFTGIATVGTGPSISRTIDWLSSELSSLPSDSNLQTICESLAQRAAMAMKPYGSRGVLTLVLAAAAVGEPFRVAVISNSDWGSQPPKAKSRFDIAIHAIKKPLCLVNGFRECVRTTERHRLKALAKAVDRAPAEILDELVRVNAIASGRSRGYVSEACWVTSQVADGRVRRWATRNVGDRAGWIPQLTGGMDLSAWIEKNFRAAPGKEIKLVQSAGVIAGPGDATPVPPPEGQPRRFTLSGSSARGVLRSGSGQPCASIDIVQLACTIEARCNEEVTLPIAHVQLGDAALPCPESPRPLLPWPNLTPDLALDGATVPRGWEYSVGYWFEGGLHHVTIPVASRGIRNLAFLGEDDELVIVCPVSATECMWKPSEDGPRATLQARVWWRKRLDGTRG